MSPGLEALLLTGVFGVGKSTVAADLAEVLEGAGVSYAALDLDWLTCSNARGPTRADEHRMMLDNVAAVVGNYRDVGTTHFVWPARSATARSWRAWPRRWTCPCGRSSSRCPTSRSRGGWRPIPPHGRRDDLARSATWLAGSLGSGLADLTVTNDRPVRTVAIQIARWLSWPVP